MHSLGWLVSASPARSKLFSMPVGSGSVLCELRFGILMLSQSNPAESQELETYKEALCVDPMRDAELLEKMDIVLMSNFLMDYTQKLCEYVVFCLYYMPDTRQTYAGCKRCGPNHLCVISQISLLN